VTDFEDAVRVLETANRAEVLALLLGFSDQQRKTFGPKFRHWLTHGSDAHVPRERESLAVVATAGGVRQAMLFATHGWGLTEEFVEDAVHVLARRSPAWLPDFVEAVLNEEGSWNWRVARGLVRHDLVPTPDNPEYYRGTVRGVPDYNVKNRQPLIEQLAKDPGLIGDHLLKMLATEGTGRLLAFHDHYMESTYDHRPEVAPYPQGTWRALVRPCFGSYSNPVSPTDKALIRHLVRACFNWPADRRPGRAIRSADERGAARTRGREPTPLGRLGR